MIRLDEHGGDFESFYRATSLRLSKCTLRVMDAVSGNFVSSMEGSPKATADTLGLRQPVLG